MVTRSHAADGRALNYAPAGLSNLRPGWSGDTGFAGRAGSALTIVVNTGAVTDLPRDWADLTAPDYHDTVVFLDPRQSGTARDLLAAMVAALGQGRHLVAVRQAVRERHGRAGCQRTGRWIKCRRVAARW